MTLRHRDYPHATASVATRCVCGGPFILGELQENSVIFHTTGNLEMARGTWPLKLSFKDLKALSSGFSQEIELGW